MPDYDSTVKFDSQQAERNVASFTQKIGQLAKRAKEASKEAAALDSNSAKAQRSLQNLGVNAQKAASGMTGYGRASAAAASGASKLMSALRPTTITGATRAIGGLTRETDRLSVAARAASVSSDRISNNLGKLSTRAVKAARDISAIGPALNKMASGSNKSGQAFDRLTARLGKLASDLRRTATAAQVLVRVLAQLGITTRLNVTGVSSLGTAAVKAANGNAKLNASMGQTLSASSRYNAAIKISQRNLGGLAGELVRVRNLAIYFAAGLGVGQFVEYIDAANQIRARLSLLGGTYEQTAILERKLQRVSLDTRTGYKENAALFTKLALSGKAYGISADSALAVTQNIARAMKISGSSTSETAAATQQLSQAFSSGKLNGDELRSVLENSPRLALALSTELADLGITLGNVRDKAADGKIGISELVRAFGGENITKQLREEFKLIPVTIGDALLNAKTKLISFLSDLDRSLGITRVFVTAIDLVADNFDKIAIAAGIAGAAVLLSYVPSLIAATRETRIFIATNIAKYGLDIATSYRTAAGGIGLFTGSLTGKKISSWSDLLVAARLNLGNLGKLASRVFLRIPALAAVGAVGLAAFSNQTRLTATNAASMQDYLVSGFQIAFEKIGQFARYLGNLVDKVFTFFGNRILTVLSQIYNFAETIINAVRFAGETAAEVGRLVPGGETADFGRPVDNFRRRQKSGLAEDFSSVISGTELDKRAKARALKRDLSRFQTGGIGSATIPPSGGVDGDAKDRGGKKGKDGNSEAASKLESLRGELNSLRSSLDPVEKARQQFNDGMKTLDASVKANILSTADYKDLVIALAKDTFPGLKDGIADLTKENDKLKASIAGESEGSILFSEKVKEVEDQIAIIDKLVKSDGDRSGVLQKQRDALIGQVSSFKELVLENDKLKAADEARLERIRQITSLVDDALNKLQESFTNAIKGALSTKGNTFKNLFKSIGTLFRDTLATSLSASLFAPIQAKLKSSLERSFGVGSRGPSGSSGGGSTNVAGVPLSTSVGKVFKDFVEDTSQSKNNEAASTVRAANDNTTEDIVVTGNRPARGFFESFNLTFTKSVKSTFKSVTDVLAKPLGKLAKSLGISSEGLGKFAGKITAGAAVGGVVADLGKALGLKTSKLGGQIGGGIGAASGLPGGELIGAAIGSIVGGAFKKTKKASASLSTDSNGQVVAAGAVGNSGSFRAAADGLASTTKGKIGEIAQSLGGSVTSGLNLGSIGSRKGKFTFDASGSNKTKGSGVQSFKTEEEAIAAAVKNALTKGVISGLSATADKVLRTFKDIDRAIVVAGTIENVKRQAAAIRDPVKAALDQVKKDTEALVAIFREAGASSEDYADLLATVTDQMKQATDQQLGQLREFRESLTSGDLSFASPTTKLQAADAKFRELETRLAKGEFIDQSTFTAAGQNFQSLGRDVFGSTPEFAAIQNRLITATDLLINNAQSQADAYKPITDAILAQTKAAEAAAAGVASQSVAQTELLQQIANSLGASVGVSGGRSLFDPGSFVRAA